MKKLLLTIMLLTGISLSAGEFEDKKKACDNKDYAACSELGSIYELGDASKKQDYAKAIEIYVMACDAGNADACANLGNMYEHGKGLKEDHKKAEELYAKSCFGQSGFGCYKLGVLYYEAQAPGESTSVVRSLFREACTLGEMLGCKNHKLLQKSYRHFERMK